MVILLNKCKCLQFFFLFKYILDKLFFFSFFFFNSCTINLLAASLMQTYVTIHKFKNLFLFYIKAVKVLTHQKCKIMEYTLKKLVASLAAKQLSENIFNIKTKGTVHL